MNQKNRSGSWLLEQFEKRRRENPKFSRNAFAREIGIPPGRLSEVISGKRSMSRDCAERIMSNLALSTEERSEVFHRVMVDKLSRYIEGNLPTSPSESVMQAFDNGTGQTPLLLHARMPSGQFKSHIRSCQYAIRSNQSWQYGFL